VRDGKVWLTYKTGHVAYAPALLIIGLRDDLARPARHRIASRCRGSENDTAKPLVASNFLRRATPPHLCRPAGIPPAVTASGWLDGSSISTKIIHSFLVDICRFCCCANLKLIRCGEAREDHAIEFIGVSGNIDEAANIAETDYKRSPHAKTAMQVGSDA
jgi:hypothetical protein